MLLRVSFAYRGGPVLFVMSNSYMRFGLHVGFAGGEVHVAAAGEGEGGEERYCVDYRFNHGWILERS